MILTSAWLRWCGVSGVGIKSISFVVLVLSAVAFAGDLPFIEVDPGTTTALRERGSGRPFVAVGVNYFDHETGWAPQLWKKFD